MDNQIQNLLELHNAVRRHPLVISPTATAIAQTHSSAMSRTHILDHDKAGDGPFRIRLHGLGFCGENIGFNYADVAAVMRGWMGSPPHRANILNEGFHSVGFGIVGRYYTAVYLGSVGNGVMLSGPITNGG